MTQFVTRPFAHVDSLGSRRLILDLRGNGGGNNYLNQPLVHALIRRPELDRTGRLFVIVDRGTFSAAVSLAADLQRETHALFVGEPTGGAPNLRPRSRASPGDGALGCPPELSVTEGYFHDMRGAAESTATHGVVRGPMTHGRSSCPPRALGHSHRRPYDRLVSADPRTHRNRSIRLIALFKLFKAAMFIVVGFGTLQLLKPGVETAVRDVLDALATHADRQAIQRFLAMYGNPSPRRIEIIAAGAFLYACLCAVEGLGLWWEKRWAEVVVVIATLSVVPVELLALARHLSFTRLTALLVNLAVAMYLVHCLRKPRAGA